MSKTELRLKAEISIHQLARMGKNEGVSKDTPTKICVTHNRARNDIIEITHNKGKLQDSR
ncbi:MAG: hypothetical protein RSC68_24350 [Acinetobacter sp.]